MGTQRFCYSCTHIANGYSPCKKSKTHLIAAPTPALELALTLAALPTYVELADGDDAAAVCATLMW